MHRDPQRWKKHANTVAKALAAAVVVFLAYAWVESNTWTLSARLLTLAIAAPLAYFFVVSDAHFFVISQPNVNSAPQAAVVVRIKLGSGEFGSEAERARIQRATDEMAKKLDDTDLGFFDGDEYGQGECRLFLHGKNADSLFAHIENQVREDLLFAGAIIEMYLPRTKSPYRTVTV